MKTTITIPKKIIELKDQEIGRLEKLNKELVEALEEMVKVQNPKRIDFDKGTIGQRTTSDSLHAGDNFDAAIIQCIQALKKAKS